MLSAYQRHLTPRKKNTFVYLSFQHWSLCSRVGGLLFPGSIFNSAAISLIDGCWDATLIQLWLPHQTNLLYFQSPELHKQWRHIQIWKVNEVAFAKQGQQQMYERVEVGFQVEKHTACWFYSAGESNNTGLNSHEAKIWFVYLMHACWVYRECLFS